MSRRHDVVAGTPWRGDWTAGALTSAMDIRLDDLSGPEIHRLLEEHLRDMYEVSPPASVHAFAIGKLRAPEVSFWTAWSGPALLGCGALRELTPKHGEIKAMRTSAEHRRQGTARAVLEHIVEAARRRYYERLSLETGSMTAFAPARQLYESAGFTYCPLSATTSKTPTACS